MNSPISKEGRRKSQRFFESLSSHPSPLSFSLHPVLHPSHHASHIKHIFPRLESSPEPPTFLPLLPLISFPPPPPPPPTLFSKTSPHHSYHTPRSSVPLHICTSRLPLSGTYRGVLKGKKMGNQEIISGDLEDMVSGFVESSTFLVCFQSSDLLLPLPPTLVVAADGDA